MKKEEYDAIKKEGVDLESFHKHGLDLKFDAKRGVLKVVKRRSQ